jgi:cytochrome c biogenesis factor
MTRPRGDLYLTLRRLDAESVELGLDTSPMVWLIWLGGLTVAAGGFWSLGARRVERRKARDAVTADV